jgi:hypothetical protein
MGFRGFVPDVPCRSECRHTICCETRLTSIFFPIIVEVLPWLDRLRALPGSEFRASLSALSAYHIPGSIDTLRPDEKYGVKSDGQRLVLKKVSIPTSSYYTNYPQNSILPIHSNSQVILRPARTQLKNPIPQVHC